MAKIRTCQVCNRQIAIHYLQYIADDKPEFYAPGWHVYGFKATPVCDDCKTKIQREYADKEGKDRPNASQCS